MALNVDKKRKWLEGCLTLIRHKKGLNQNEANVLADEYGAAIDEIERLKEFEWKYKSLCK